MAQRLVNVITAFNLNLNRGGHLEQLRFEAGVQKIDEDVADHWYAKAHLGAMPSAADAPDTAAAMALHAELQIRAEALAVVEQDLGEREARLAAAEQDLSQRADRLSETAAELRELEASLKEREAKVAAAEQSSSKKTGAK